MSQKLFGSLALTCLMCIGLHADNKTQPSTRCGTSPRPMRVSARHIEANGIGYHQGYTTVEGFFSTLEPFRENWVPFLDLRGHVFNNGKLAANAGLGMRYMTSSRIWGMNAYYDYRNTTHQHYNQASVGLESLGRIWDFRLNGYLPVGDKSSSLYDAAFKKFRNHYMILSRKREFAMKGANAEVGFHVNKFEKEPLYFAAGPYYLEGQGRVAWGGQVRGVVDLYDYVRLEGNASYDNVFHWIGQGQVSVIVPFGAKRNVKRGNSRSCSLAMALSDRALQRVDRMEIVPVDKKHVRKKAIDPATGKPYVFWFVNNTSSSNGTYESAFPTLVQAQNASGPGDIIYVMPGNGLTSGMSDGIILQDNQKFWGGTIAHRLQTTVGTITIPSLAHGTFADSFPSMTVATAPVIANLSGTDVITAANNNEISGFYIQNPYGNAVTASSVNNLSVTHCIIQGGGLTGNPPIYGVNLNNVAGTVVISRNMFSQVNAGVNIAATGIQNANYIMSKNDAVVFNYSPTVALGNFLNASYVNCANLSTTVSGNDLNIVGAALNMTFDNTTAGLSTCPVTVIGNNLNCDASAGGYALLYTLNDYANVDLAVWDNSFSSPSGGAVGITQTGSSQMHIAMSNNQAALLNNPLYVALSNSAQLTGFVSKNDFQIQNGAGVLITAADTTSIPYFTISQNQMAFSADGGFGGVSVATTVNATATLDISSNTIKGAYDGVYLAASDSSIMTASVKNNTISQTHDFGVYLITANSGVGNWTVDGNRFIATATFDVLWTSGAVYAVTNGGVINLNFNYNLAAPISFLRNHFRIL